MALVGEDMAEVIRDDLAAAGKVYAGSEAECLTIWTEICDAFVEYFNAHFDGGELTTPVAASQVAKGAWTNWENGDAPSSTDVETALDELVTDLAEKTGAAACGADRIGSYSITGALNSVPSGSVRDQIAGVLGDLDDHIQDTAAAHNASAILKSTWEHAWENGDTLTSTDVEEAIDEIVEDLGMKTSAAACGADRIGSYGTTGATYYNLAAGSVRDQVVEVEGDVNSCRANLQSHLDDSSDAHDASAISNTATGFISSTNVQSSLAEICTDLGSITAGASGSGLVGYDGYSWLAPGGKAVEDTFDSLISGLAETGSGIEGATRIGKGATPSWANGDTVTGATVEAVIDEIVSELAATAGADRVGKGAWSHNWKNADALTSARVETALDEIVQDLAAAASKADCGADRVGAYEYVSSPHSLTTGSVRDQLVQLAGYVNAHETDAAGAHAASAISKGAWSSWENGDAPSSTDVEAAVDELVTDLAQKAGATTCGADRIGVYGASGSPNALTTASVRDALVQLLGFINTNADAIELRALLASAANARTLLTGSLSTAGYDCEILDWDCGSYNVRLIAKRTATSYYYEWWFTVNARVYATDTTQFEKDSTSYPSFAVRVNRQGAGFYYRKATTGTWDADSGWTSSWAIGGLSTYRSTWISAGEQTERGQCGLGAKNVDASTAATCFACAGVNFKAVFSSAPSSVTVAYSDRTRWTTTPAVDQITAYGFRLSGESDSCSAGYLASWYGYYTIGALS